MLVEDSRGLKSNEYEKEFIKVYTQLKISSMTFKGLLTLKQNTINTMKLITIETTTRNCTHRWIVSPDVQPDSSTACTGN